MAKQIGKTVEVLFETYREGYSEGYTKNYTPVRIYSENDYRGIVKKILITEANKDFCTGTEK
jgi:threonylcarbamoyladenosine tRNA methylthiotransferase MtaB